MKYCYYCGNELGNDVSDAGAYCNYCEDDMLVFNPKENFVNAGDVITFVQGSGIVHLSKMQIIKMILEVDDTDRDKISAIEIIVNEGIEEEKELKRRRDNGEFCINCANYLSDDENRCIGMRNIKNGWCCGFKKRVIEMKNQENAEFSKDLFINLKIPYEKILLEINRKKTFIGFPFFLRKVSEEGRVIEVVLMHNYPEANKSYVRMKHNGKFPVRADRLEKLIISDEIINTLLSEGFIWYHESELDTMW